MESPPLSSAASSPTLSIKRPASQSPSRKRRHVPQVPVRPITPSPFTPRLFSTIQMNWDDPFTPQPSITPQPPLVFTVDPQLATKRQERLAKNRASAIQARQRKAEHVKHLEQQVELLRTENTMLKDRLQEVESRLREMELEREKELHEITRTTQAWLDERTFQDLENQFLFLDHVTPRTSFAPARETLVFQLLYHKVAAILLLMLVFSAAIISIPFAHRDVIRNDPQDMPSIAMTTEKSLAHVSTDKAVTVHPRFKLHKPIETVE